MKLVFGVGQNNADYAVHSKVGGRRVVCPFYRRWVDMLRRCYSDEFQRDKPTYVGCEVVESWHLFMAFKGWMETQNWLDAQLDKDFLGGGRLYSPETCVFIPGWLNALFNTHSRRLRELPIGVTRDRDRKGFYARLRIDGALTYINHYTTVEEASAAYRQARSEYVRSKYSQLEARLIDACERMLK